MNTPTKSQLAAADRKFRETFEKSYGPGRRLRDDSDVVYDVIPTGSMSLDTALGVGGYVRGRIVECYGPPDAGKTTLALQAVREAQLKYPDLHVGWVDMEHKFDRPWARRHGVDLARLDLVAPTSAEEASDMVKMMTDSGVHVLVVLDSIGSMIDRASMEKDADEATVANVARIVTRMVNNANASAEKTGTCVWIINQIRANITTGGGKGAQTTTTGGWNLKFATTQKIKLRRVNRETKDKLLVKVPDQAEKIEVGHEVAAKVERNKVAHDGRTASFLLITMPTADYGPVGIDKADEAFTMCNRLDLWAEKKGSWLTFPTVDGIEGARVNGRNEAIAYLRTDLAMVATIRLMALNSVVGTVQAEPVEVA